MQNHSTNTELTAAKVQAVTIIPWTERELVSLILWASLRSVTSSEHQCCQIITEWTEPFMVGHLHGVPMASGLW